MQAKRIIPLVVVVLALALVGCQNKKHKTPNEQAQKRWGAARASVLAALAKGQLENGQFDKSRKTLDQAKALDPTSSQLYLLSGRLALEQNQLDVADREFAEARRLDPKNAEVDYLSGVVHQRWLKPQTAFDYYTAAAEKGPKEAAYPLAQAEMLIQLNRSDDALALLQSRLEDFGTSAPIYDTIGQLFLGRGDYKQAVETLRQASVLASDDLQIREHLAMAMYFNRQYAEAADQLARVMRDPANAKRSELHVALGECQLHLSRARDARASFETATQLSPSSAPAWLSLTKAALALNDARRAEVSLRKAIALAPENSENHLMFGYLRLKQDKLPEALAAFKKAAALDPSDPVSLCMIGHVLERSGKPQQAVQYYGRALKVKPHDELATKMMASVGE